jgi:hypothetical protein
MEAVTMPAYSDIQTRALGEILRSSKFSDISARKRVSDLVRLENWLLRQPKGMAANVLLKQMRGRYPLETLRFESEIKQGEYLGEAKAISIHAMAERASQIEELATAKRLADEETRDRENWLAAGGLP